MLIPFTANSYSDCDFKPAFDEYLNLTSVYHNEIFKKIVDSESDNLARALATNNVNILPYKLPYGVSVANIKDLNSFIAIFKLFYKKQLLANYMELNEGTLGDFSSKYSFSRPFYMDIDCDGLKEITDLINNFGANINSSHEDVPNPLTPVDKFTKFIEIFKFVINSDKKVSYALYDKNDITPLLNFVKSKVGVKFAQIIITTENGAIFGKYLEKNREIALKDAIKAR